MLRLTNLALRRGPQLLFADANLSLARGQKLGLTGANGCGKSSLFALVRNELHADDGDWRLSPDWSLAFVAQETDASPRPALEFVIDGDDELRRVQARLQQAEQTGDGSQIAACHVRLEEIDGYQAEARAAKLLTYPNGHDAESNKLNLLETFTLFERTLKGLLDGDATLGLPGTSQPGIRRQLGVVNDLWAEFKPVVSRGSAEGAKIDRGMIEKLAASNLPLLREMNKAVGMYEKEAAK